MSEKPPIGIMPKQVYEIQRVKDISRALYEYSQTDYLVDNKDNFDLFIDWTEELQERLGNLADNIYSRTMKNKGKGI